MKIWAIADLHLSFSSGKPMDKFGEHWIDHHEKVRCAWIERVGADDIVLLPGDFSWAMRANEVAADFAWLAALPGRKVMIKGNHDYWWPGSNAKLNALLPEGVYGIKKRAVVVGGVPIVGVRGGDFFSRDAELSDSIMKGLERERRELLQSIDHLHEVYDGDRAPIAMFHYPPFPIGGCESAFTRILEDAGVRHCVFGHLHSAPEWERVFQGESRGVHYRLVACDALDFVPTLIDEV